MFQICSPTACSGATVGCSDASHVRWEKRIDIFHQRARRPCLIYPWLTSGGLDGTLFESLGSLRPRPPGRSRILLRYRTGAVDEASSTSRRRGNSPPWPDRRGPISTSPTLWRYAGSGIAFAARVRWAAGRIPRSESPPGSDRAAATQDLAKVTAPVLSGGALRRTSSGERRRSRRAVALTSR